MVIELLVGLSAIEAVNRQTRKLDPKRRKRKIKKRKAPRL